jgi:hypothetical protein
VTRERGFGFGRVTAARLNAMALSVIGTRVLVVDFRGTWADRIAPGLRPEVASRVSIWTRDELCRLAGTDEPLDGLRVLRLVGTVPERFGIVVLFGAPGDMRVRDAYELASSARVLCELDNEED